MDVILTDPRLFQRLRGLYKPSLLQPFEPISKIERSLKAPRTYPGFEAVVEARLRQFDDDWWSSRTRAFTSWVGDLGVRDFVRNGEDTPVELSGIQIQAGLWSIFEVNRWLTDIQSHECLWDISRLSFQEAPHSVLPWLENSLLAAMSRYINPPNTSQVDIVWSSTVEVLGNRFSGVEMVGTQPWDIPDFNAYLVSHFLSICSYPPTDLAPVITRYLLAPMVYQRLWLPWETRSLLQGVQSEIFVGNRKHEEVIRRLGDGVVSAASQWNWLETGGSEFSDYHTYTNITQDTCRDLLPEYEEPDQPLPILGKEMARAALDDLPLNRALESQGIGNPFNYRQLSWATTP